jgi:hypothetical protein
MGTSRRMLGMERVQHFRTAMIVATLRKRR